MTPSDPRGRRPHVLLCSGWQTHNIGDVAHTPAALTLLERHLPDVDVTVWAFRPLGEAAHATIARRFPRVAIVEGAIDADGSTSDPATLAAIDAADFALHSSGPATLAWRHLEFFAARTRQPFGVYGVTYGLYGIPELATLSRAAFVYFRDRPSLDAALRDGVRAPIMDWSPDVAFAYDARDDAAATRYLRSVGLDDGHFMCCIGRLRNTPFWLMPGRPAPLDPEKDARNQAMADHDLGPLRDAIAAVVHGTDLRVLLCPEDRTHVAVNRTHLLERLPGDVRARVILREQFWTPEEALGVYVRSAGLFGAEMHSPILCVGSGVPAIVCRWAEQSTKGLMWQEIGLGDWLFDLDDDANLPRVAPSALAMARDPAGSAARAGAARDAVRRRFAQTMDVVARAVVRAAADRVR